LPSLVGGNDGEVMERDEIATMPELKYSLSEGELVAGNYRILGVAGAGGMGVVYRARDLRLERVVALKFLPPELNASEADRERFLREARLASSLDHPNIGVIHGVEVDAEGRTFIIMAFYEGASLAEHIRSGRLDTQRSVEIAEQMARGLAEAHARGIVHRDVKPSNVMVTSSGLVKIVDFGLAHAVSAQTETQTGIRGTVAYMSPEQAMGMQVDQRCDVWALGVVLAEMLTGVNPFHGESVPAMLFNVLNEAPQGIGSLDPALQPILYRALTKDAERRYGSCAELLGDLEGAQTRIAPSVHDGDAVTGRLSAAAARGVRESAQTRRARADASRSAWRPAAPKHSRLLAPILGGLLVVVAAGLVVGLVPMLRQRVKTLLGGAPPERHIAVLPFDNIGSTPENAALADGLMDSLAGRLSNLDVGSQSLWVVPNSEVRRRNVTDPSEALKELGANLVVKGSVERDGSDIHLTVNLIDTKNLRQIGSADVEDHAGDLSTLEDEAVARLAGLMNISVTAGMLRNTGGRVNPAAYEDYLTALGYMQRYDKPGNLGLAIAALENSVKTDPRFAVGYAQLGEAYRLRYRVDQNPEWLTEAEANCKKAIELDSSIPEPYDTLGSIHSSTGKYDLALGEFQKALALNARDPAALGGLARAYENAGRLADAEAAYRKAAAIRPDDWDGYNNLGGFLQRQRKYSDAIAQYQHALQLAPDNAQVLLNLGGTYIDSGDAKNLPLAEAALRESIKLSPSYGAYANLGFLLYQEHRYREAVDATQHALSLNAVDYSVWENLRLAFEWLNDASGAQKAASSEKLLVLDTLKLHPQDPNVVSVYADLCARFGPRDQAESHIQTALALSPNDPNILEAVATAYENLGNRKMALKYMNEAFAKGFPWQVALDDPEAQQLLKDPGLHPPKK
jgi:serine/threonine-protein kinase